MIIGLSGYGGSGKDAVANYLVEHHGFGRVAFADPLKAVLYDLNPIIGDSNGRGPSQRLAPLVDELGWEAVKRIAEGRALPQRLGEAMRDNVYEDVWVDVAMLRALTLARCAISDCRYPNEYAAIKDHGGCIVRVMRPGVAAVNAHISETAIDHLPECYRIDNNGTLEELGDKVDEMLEKLGVL